MGVWDPHGGPVDEQPHRPSGDEQYTAVAWYPNGRPPGPPPGAPPPFVGGPPGPPAAGPPDPGPRQRRPLVIAAIAAAAVLVVGAAVGVAVGTSGSDGGTSASGTGSVSAPTTRGSGAGTVTDAPSTQSAVTTATSPSAPVTPTAAPTQLYGGPGGITVQGPVGWLADASSGVVTVSDYRDPASPARLAGATFRIGVGNADPGASFENEVAQSAEFLRTQYATSTVSTPTYSTYLGTTAADIEYQYVNPTYGVARHGIERIWRHGGVTMIIQSSDIATNWAGTAAVFQTLVASAQVG